MFPHVLTWANIINIVNAQSVVFAPRGYVSNRMKRVKNKNEY